MTEYRQGSTATLLTQFYAYAGGPPANVTNLTVTISPTGGGAAVIGPTSVGVVNESTGLYSYAWTIDGDQEVGTYVVEWNADGGITAAETIDVIQGASATYATLAELKLRLGIEDTTDDAMLSDALESASRWVDGWCRRRFYNTTEARYFSSTDLYWLDVDDLVSITSIKTDSADDGTFETTWAQADYQLHPINRPDGQPYNRIRAVASNTWALDYGYPRSERVEVTAQWGWPAIPAPVKAATLIVAAETFKLKDTFAGAGGFGEFGPVQVRRSPQALDLLKPYRRMPVLVA